ncbi:type I-F CRISPR-associated protein Csy1 [Marispirochaeta sp.]|uniref:type I-F CRISPR-associated protein Csy1 n=1 Tax=Marispirochaeta sp. TaxID=2038653 RepID=UPI0029C6DB5F|nr:type I-F CRISPR-associated protein Csy1 [Marispirochaeta sp.]
MPDPAIREYFKTRRENWINEKLKKIDDENEKQLVILQGDEKFNPNQWLPNAAIRARQIKISSHPCTFSHPSANKHKNKDDKTTAIIAKKPKKNDGYLRTGNVESDLDALGNAAVLDVYAFLNLTMEDGRNLIEHIESETIVAKELLNIPTATYENLRKGFLAMITNEEKETITSSRIKQVYFPIDSENYHLLSILSNSGIIYDLKDRINKFRFSEEHKELREMKRKNEYSENGFKEIYDTTTIGYGGANPQNISVFNTINRGRSYLLLSAPPTLTKREIRFPRKNFFFESIRYYHIREPLQKLHGIFKSGVDSVIPRRNLESGRDNRIEEILDAIILRMSVIRTVSSEQYNEETSELPYHQKIWLLEINEKKRNDQDEWLNTLCSELSNWIITAYRKTIKNPIILGSAERQYIEQLVETNKEALR